MSIVDQTPANEPETRSSRLILLVLLLSALFWVAGCGGYYTASPGYYGPNYGPGPYYGGGSVAIAVGDRPYYRGPGYWSGRTYYVWKPGHWTWRHGQQVWIRGHYVVRGY
jgi:WXXGXW repeat (2 copies)